MVECCIAGIPTISSNTDGAKQFIINEFNGLIINSREPNYYIEAINKIIKSLIILIRVVVVISFGNSLSAETVPHSVLGGVLPFEHFITYILT